MSIPQLPQIPHTPEHADRQYSNRELLLTHFSPTVLERTETDRVQEDRDGVYYVQTQAGLRYRVQISLSPTDVYVICNCRNGRRVGNWPTCHHAAAVLGRLLAQGDHEVVFADD